VCACARARTCVRAVRWFACECAPACGCACDSARPAGAGAAVARRLVVDGASAATTWHARTRIIIVCARRCDEEAADGAASRTSCLAHTNQMTRRRGGARNTAGPPRARAFGCAATLQHHNVKRGHFQRHRKSQYTVISTSYEGSAAEPPLSTARDAAKTPRRRVVWRSARRSPSHRPLAPASSQFQRRRAAAHMARRPRVDDVHISTQ
jgi:hypothetical protein